MKSHASPGAGELRSAPPVSSFPAVPAAWYWFGHTADLRHGPLTRKLFGRDLVAFRAAGGKVGVLDAHCSHLGAHLGCGKVAGETIECPFHNWRYATDGRCVRTSSGADIPPFARQESYPAIERHGHLFFFNGPRAFFPLPFFEGDDPGEFAAARAFSFVAHSQWFMVAAQGFDTQHFETVHDRRLLRPPRTDSPSAFARRNRYEAEILGHSVRDRILRALVGREVSLTITNWAGTLYVVKAEFSRACSRFIVCFEPLEDETTLCHTIVFARRGWPALGLSARRAFTRGHLLSEAAQVRDTRYRPARFVAADADMVECFRWLAALPQRPAPDIHDRRGNVVVPQPASASQPQSTNP